jgi:hypothetical protein
MKKLLIENKKYSYGQFRNILKNRLVNRKLTDLVMTKCIIYGIPNTPGVVFRSKIRHFWWDYFRWFDIEKDWFFGFRCENCNVSFCTFIAKKK